MVDPDILRHKSDRILHHVDRLRSRSDLTEEALRDDEDLWNTVLMDLQQAVQGCIDLAAHVCVDDGLGAPEGPAGAFALLARAGRIDEALSLRLAGAAGLRNLIVHRYGDLDPPRVLQVITSNLQDLQAFVRALYRRQDGPPTP
jgi:uncharacterized protein YutE (UPF0331/DUF86 family)